MSFSEGFTSGFNMVDSAMQRRQTNELKNQELADQKARYANEVDLKNREMGLKAEADKAQAGYNDRHLAAVTAGQAADDAYRTQSLANQNSGQIRQDNYNSTSLGYQNQERIRNDTARAEQLRQQGIQTEAIAKENAAQTTKLNIENRAAKKLADVNAAKPILESMVDPKTNLLTFSTQPEIFKQQKNALATMTNLPIDDMYNNPAEFDQHINNIKNGLSDREHWGQNKDSVIHSLNATMSKDIEAGKVGQPYDGTNENFKGSTIDSIKIIDVFPSPGANGVIAGVETTYRLPNGKFVKDKGPMTELRSGNPETDPNIKIIPHAAIIGKLDAINQLSKAINSDPVHLRMIQSMMKNKDDKGDYSIVNSEMVDPDGNNIKKPESILDKNSGELTTYNPPGQVNNQANVSGKIKYDKDGNGWILDKNNNPVPATNK
jgi:hypothetical protein